MRAAGGKAVENTMKTIECSGTHREMGRQAGEQLRDEIARHVERRKRLSQPGFEQELPGYLSVLRRELPDVLEEMDGVAEGANIAARDIYLLNFTRYPDSLNVAEEGCTNIAFVATPDGPAWGENNDLEAPAERLPQCVRIVRPARGIPLIMISRAGMVAAMDGMNAEGLCLGNSSVGSVFQQSREHVCIRMLGYAAMLHSRNVSGFVRRMTSRPTRGKGYSMLCLDRSGTAVSIEAPCPLVQVRRMTSPRGMHCVNVYQLPQLSDADRRTPGAKRDALARRKLLEEYLSSDAPCTVDAMQKLLRLHGPPQALCRHGEVENMYTACSMIGLPRRGVLLVAEGYPCESEYEEISI